jgi:hypothetical protein
MPDGWLVMGGAQEGAQGVPSTQGTACNRRGRLNRTG